MRPSLISPLLLILASCQPASAPPPKPPVTLPVKITQFYASPPRIPKGETTLLCYGVEAAAEVKLDPPVESLHPSIARCFEVRPAATTSYELIAIGRNGDRTSSKVSVVVGASRVKFVDLMISAQEVKAGEPVNFCFKAVNARKVEGGPGKFKNGGQPTGDCLIDAPRQTTTYRLTVSGADGEADSESITVRVR